MTEVKDVLPLAEEIMRFNVCMSEMLAFHRAVYEKADMERMPLDRAAYKVVEDIRYYLQLGGLKLQRQFKGFSKQQLSTDFQTVQIYWYQ